MRQQMHTGIESYVVLALVAGLPVAFASGFTMYEALKGGVLLSGAAVVAVAWIVGMLRAGSVRVRSVLGVIALAALCLFTLLSCLWAPHGAEALWASSRWIALGVVGIAVLAPTGRPLSFSHLVLAIAVGTGVAGVLGVLDVFGVPLDASAPGSEADGFRGSFDNDRAAVIALSGCVPLLAAGVFAIRSPIRWVAAAALAPLGFYLGAMGQWESIAIAAGGFVLAGGLVIARRSDAASKLAMPAAALGVALVLGVGGFFVAPAVQPQEVVQVGGKVVAANAGPKTFTKTPLEVELGRPNPPRNAGQRAHARATGWNLFTRHVVGGVGAGNFEVAQVGDLAVSSDWYQKTNESYPGVRLLDNSLLQLLVELGVIGLLLFLLVLGLALRSAWIRATTDDAPVEVFGVAAGLLGMTVAFALGGLLEGSFGALMVVLLAAVLLGRGADEDGWELGSSKGVGGVLERFGLGLAVPAVAAALMAYLGVAGLASDYFKARGDVWVQAGALDRCQEAYLQALSWWSGNDEAALSYAIVTVTRNQGFTEEERSLLTALEMRPFDPRLYRAMGQVQIREAVERKKKGEPPKEPKRPGEKPDPAEMMKALELVDKAVLNKANANFSRAIDLHPRYTAAREARANAFLLVGDPKKQQTELLKAIDQLGDTDRKATARIHAALATSYLTAEDWKKARKHIERALTLDPEHPRRNSLGEDLSLIRAREAGIKPKKDAHGHDH